MADPTVQDHEDLYDAHIAPLLLEAAKIADANGLPFVALVQYGPGEHDVGRTECRADNGGWPLSLAAMAARARGNLDAVVVGARQMLGPGHHGSLVLDVLNRHLWGEVTDAH